MTKRRRYGQPFLEELAAEIRIAITQAAFEAIARTLPLGTVGHKNEVNAKSERYVWLEPNVVDRLRFLRGPGESFSDVILRLVETEGACCF